MRQTFSCNGCNSPGVCNLHANKGIEKKGRETPALKASTLLQLATDGRMSSPFSEIKREAPMVSLFPYPEGLVVDPLLNPFNHSPLDSPSFPVGSTDHPKVDLSSLFDQVPPGFFKNLVKDHTSEIAEFDISPSGSSPTTVCINHRELLDLWLQKLYNLQGDGSWYDGRSPLCRDLKRRIEGLVARLLSGEFLEFEEGGPCSCSLLKLNGATMRRKVAVAQRQALSDMLKWVRQAASCPLDWMALEGGQERPEQLQRAREILLPNKRVCNEESPELPYLRRSKRLKKKANIVVCPESRKRIPIGPSFQADLPDWKGPGKSNEPDDARLMGTCVWLTQGNDGNHAWPMIGKGMDRDLCSCTYPGSVECIRLHVELSRLELKHNLGPAFSSLGMDQMGEEVSKSWTDEEKTKFESIVRENRVADGWSFMQTAFESFPSKSQQSIVNYYYDVFVPARMSIQTRSPNISVNIDSDNEEEQLKKKGNKATKVKYLKVKEGVGRRKHEVIQPADLE